jgi:hypothetical protein
MTPKEKAEELVNKFNYESKHYLMLDAKQCALIVVTEIIKEKSGCSKYECYGQDINWNEVKKEIENL